MELFGKTPTVRLPLQYFAENGEEEVLAVGAVFKINSTTIDGMYSFPDMGASPNPVSVNSFDNTKFEKSIQGRQSVQTLDFDFHLNKKTGNYNAAVAAESSEIGTYTLTLGDGLPSYTILGTHQTFVTSTSAENDTNYRFRISITVHDIQKV